MSDAGSDGFVRGIRLGERVGGVMTEEGFDVRIDAADLVEAGLHGLARGNFALGEAAGEFVDGELVKHARRGER